MKLAPPGAPLPLVQHLFLRYIVGPYLAGRTTWEEDQARFSSAGKKILGLVHGKSAASLARPVLVSPMRGLEDSSRFWSAAMAMDHLLIVGKQVGAVTVALSKGVIPPGKASTATVKPPAGRDPEQIHEEFRLFVESHMGQVLASVENRESPLTFSHPWFGPLTAKKWYWLLGVHQKIHLQQISEITKVLP
jgi:hypothetical protein